jgi:hypothetical protein
MRVILLLSLIFPLSFAMGQDKKKKPPVVPPRILVALPFGVKPGSTTKVVLRGLKLDNAREVRVSPRGTIKLLKKSRAGLPNQMTADKVGDTQVEVELTLPADVPGETVSVVVVGPDSQSTPCLIRIDRVPPLAEKEPNDGFKQAQPVMLGQVVQGTISRPQDVDMFRFEGKAGQKVVLEVHAARYGSALDSLLTLYDASGTILETCDDIEGSTDSRIEATLPKNGIYYVGLIDANDQGADFFLYRLTLRVK